MSYSQRIARRTAFAALAVTMMGMCLVMSARADDIAGSFSIASNPNGVWSYGSLSGTTFTPFTVSSSSLASGYWTTSTSFPVVVANKTGADVFYSSWDLPTDMLNLHPDPAGIASDVRWTAPSAGMYSIAGFFEGVDYQGPTTTDVHIYLNGTDLFPGMNIASFDVHLPFSLTESLNAGDHIDFAVGFGADGNYLFDSTGLSGSITPLNQASVPEPATLFLLATGLAAMSLRGKRKSGLISE